MAAEKTLNYTPEQTADLIKRYSEGETVEALAVAFSKTARSIIAKLSREGVYKKKEYMTKGGTKPIKKDSFADFIGKACDLSEGEIDSLTKANKTALQKIASKLA